MLDDDRLRDVWERVLPRPEPITFFSRRSGSNQNLFHEYQIPRAKRKRLNEEQIANLKGAYLASRYRVWQIWLESLQAATAVSGAPLPVPEPKVNDLFRDRDGIEWIVEDVIIKLQANESPQVRNYLCIRKI